MTYLHLNPLTFVAGYDVDSDGNELREVRINRTATSAPSAGDDSTAYYVIGSRWIDTAAQREYVCVDNSAGAAVWIETSGLSGGTGTTWYAGGGAPSSGTGADGDFYLDTSSGDVYTKASGSWGSPIDNLTGPTGGGGGIQYLLDVAPGSPSTWDDEFDGSSLDAKWTNPAVSARTNTITVANGWLTLEPSDAGSGDTTTRGSNAIRQAAPTGDFTVAAKLVDGRSRDNTDDARVGIYVARTAGPTATIFGTSVGGGQFPIWTGIGSYSETVDWGAYDGSQTATSRFWQSVFWVQVRWVSASSTLYFDYSLDGMAWINHSSRGSMSQPDRIGLAIWANSANVRADHKLFCDWFRVTEP